MACCPYTDTMHEKSTNLILNERPVSSPLSKITRQQDRSLANLLICYSSGLIKNVNIANYVLLCFALLVVGISVYILFQTNTDSYNSSDYPHGIVDADET